MYSRISVTRILKKNEKKKKKKRFEFARFLVIGVDYKIQFAMLQILIELLIFNSALQCKVQYKFNFFHLVCEQAQLCEFRENDFQLAGGIRRLISLETVGWLGVCLW